MQKFKNKKIFLSFFPSSVPSFEKKRQTKLFSLQHKEKKADIEGTLFFNFPFDKGRLKNIVCWFFEKHGQYKTLKFLEKLKEVGFGAATTAGISLGIDDLKIPNQKIALLSTAETKVAKDFVHYRNAKITGIERIQRLIYTWNQTNDTLKQEVVKLFENTDVLNPIYMMAFSGARGNMSQVRQLVGMRGLMSDPQGQIIDFPIQSNFREGLTLTEYLISTYGARKGIVDTALRTATAGYLTRRLVDVAQHTIVSKFDCGTMRGIFLFDMKDGKKTIYSFQNRLIGRVLAQNIEFFEKPNEKGEVQKKQLAFRNQEIDSKLARAIANVTKKAFVRSPLSCDTSRFVCQLCYGWSLSHGKLVSVGDAVGIIAAQSIGEPGTQLTMRTFHTGGVFAGGLTDQILAPFDGKMKYLKNIPGTCVRNALSEIAFLTKMPGSFLVEKAVAPFQEQKPEASFFVHSSVPSKRKKGEVFKIPAYAVLFCRNNEFVKKKQVLAQFSSVFKKMQYGRAEQTLYSTVSGEFVFGKSFSFQNSKTSLDFPFLQSDSPPGVEKNFDTHAEIQPHLFDFEKSHQNSSFFNEQSLLLEKRKGDFSEVEAKNDILWKSQNWTTVWVFSGNIFSDFLNTNFPFEEGDFLKKTSVLRRILWTKKKQYKYFLYQSDRDWNQARQKTKNYFLAIEKKKIHDSFVFHFSFFKDSPLRFFENFDKKGIVQNIRTRFDQRFLSNERLGHSIVNFFEKSFFIAHQDVKKIVSYCNFLSFQKSQTLFSKLFFKSKKKNDFLFLRSKSTRFLTDLQKNIRNPLISSSFFLRAETKKARNMIFPKKKKNAFQSNSKKRKTHLFFRFLNKRKNFDFPFFFDFRTFSKTFQVSQKFSFFSFPSNDFSETSFIRFHFVFLKKKRKYVTFSLSTCPRFFGNFSRHTFLQDRQAHSFSFFSEKKRKKIKIFQKTSLFLNKLQENKKKEYTQPFSEKRNENRKKNIFFKKFPLRLPVEKMYYKKFAYFVSLVEKGQKKKLLRSSFQTFSTLMKKENFLADQRNRGKAEPRFLESQNFYGKESPRFLTNCFFENSQTKSGGIFSFRFFEHESKKQRILFFHDTFSEISKNKIISLKPEHIQKSHLFNRKRAQILHLSLRKHRNFFHSSGFGFEKTNTQKSENFSFLTDIDLCRNSFCIFEIPTFSFLSFSTNFFSKACSSSSNFFEKHAFLRFAQKRQNNKKNLFQNFSPQKREETLFFPLILNEKKTNLASLFFCFSENENGKNFLKNENDSKFSIKLSMPFSPYNNRVIEKKTFDDLGLKFGDENNCFRTVSPHVLCASQKNEKRTEGHSFLFSGSPSSEGKNPKILFFDFLKDSCQKGKKQEDEKRNSFFLYDFSFQRIDSTLTVSSQKQKAKSFSLEFYMQEISWLPQENSVILTSSVSKENAPAFFSFPFYSWSVKKPFLFFTNHQGKKKPFSFSSDGFSDTPRQKEKKQKRFEGFLRISKRNRYQIFAPPGSKTKKTMRKSFPLHQKVSFFSILKKSKIDRSFIGQLVKKNATLFDKFYIKSIALKFQKRVGNTKFQNIQNVFSKKTFSSQQNFSPDFFRKKSLPSSNRSRRFHEQKKTMTVFNRDFKNSHLFAKKVQNRCFTCLPFQRNFFISSSSGQNTEIQNTALLGWQDSDLRRKNFSGKNEKMQLQIEQGWLVFPFSPFLKRLFFRDHRKIQKKGHFFDKNITFEQNTVFVETVIFQNSRFSFSKQGSDSFLQREKKSFQIDFVKTNKNCRYLSFSFFQGNKEDVDGFRISYSFEKEKERSLFRPVTSQCVDLLASSLLLQKREEMVEFPNFLPNKKFNVMKFFRPFQYKILQNPKNAKKFFRDIRFQSFSKGISSSCPRLYKKYHSSFFNFQKKEKGFFRLSPNGQNQKNQSLKLEVQSNFRNLYFSREKSSYFSFDFSHKRENFQKNIKKTFFQKLFGNEKEKLGKARVFQKYFRNQLFSEQKIKNRVVGMVGNENLCFLNTLSPNFSKTFEEHARKNFFLSFAHAQKEQKNFSFYPVQFLPLVFSVSDSNSTRSAVAQNEILAQGVSPDFSLHPFQNTIEFQLSQKRGSFFDERRSFKTFFDFVKTSPFWLNKDQMNFLFSTVSDEKNFRKRGSKKNNSCFQNSVFEKNIRFYGSTEFLSPYEGEILSMFTHSMYWWKKASEISTLRRFEKLFMIVTKRDLFSLRFPFSKQDQTNAQKTKIHIPSSIFEDSNVIKQNHLKKLYDALFNISHEKNVSHAFKNQNETNGRTKILSFVTKYKKRIYTFQNLTVGYPFFFRQPVLGNFVVYGDTFFGSSVQKPGQIIHLSSTSMTLRRGQPCLVSSNGILHFSNTPYIQKNIPLVTLPYHTVQAGDIVQGIPKVEQFFEARTTLQGRLFVSSLPILLKGVFERYKILLPLEQAVRQSFLKIQQIIVDGVQRVYRSQGVSITDKHLEVVVRQMTTKVQILHGGQTGFFPGELVSLDFVERLNKFLMVKICYEPVILGITRASLEVESFLSASSFQQTTKILSLAAISRKKDFLKGLKENLLVGNLIPSGTGYFQFSKKL